MHTNGGCRCLRDDKYKAERVISAYRRYVRFAETTRAPSDAALVEALEAVRDYRISANPTAPDAHHDLVLLQHVGRLRTIAIVALAAAKGQQP